MKQNVSKGALTISRRVTRSTTTLDRNSLTLPIEVVTEIFLRLPLKSIARCRCVCKLWSSMFRSQDFTELFLTKSCARPQLLFACFDRSVIKFIFFSSPQPENPEENSNVVATNHLAGFRLSNELSGPTNGFFCYEANRIFKGMKDPVFDTVVCNPSTGQSLTLPRLKSSGRYGAQSYLGYDPIGKEFKVLSMVRLLVSGEWISVDHQVLTLGTKNLAWRSVECCVPHSYSPKGICISGVLYYTTSVYISSWGSMVACFDLRTEKFSFVKLMETFNRAMHCSTTLVNFSGKLGLIVVRDSDDVCQRNVCQASKSIELWVLLDAGKREWSKHVYVLPPSWKDVVTGEMYIVGMVGKSEIVFTPFYQCGPSYVLYFNVERTTITKVGIQGLEAFHGESFRTYLNYVQNVKLL
ncbi:hypothetical protein Bca4012_082171 [Brassica carinata]|uniref:F-box domain-containing protein n=1 Tax=Brassica carinata TaxID=52824 RepID=A0A8X8AQE1_BRACI|nr:hypothetical protein Bca52824_028590 [Brassica carinata]